MPDRGSGERYTAAGRTAAVLFLGLSILVGSHVPASPIRHHARSAVRPSPLASATQAPGSVVTRRPPYISVTADDPPAGMIHAVAPAEVAAMLDTLPERWRETVESVRLSHRSGSDVMAETDGANIELHYVVDRSGHAPVRRGEPTEEEELFGGVPVRRGGRQWVHWPQRGRLRTYVLNHLLIHEIGHHLAPPGLDDEADEEWAEQFAFEYYCPDCD